MHDIQPLADVLADDVPFMATGTARTFRLYELFNAWEVFRQRSPVRVARTGPSVGLPVVGFIFGMHGFLSGLDVLQSQFKLLRTELLPNVWTGFGVV